MPLGSASTVIPHLYAASTFPLVGWSNNPAGVPPDERLPELAAGRHLAPNPPREEPRCWRAHRPGTTGILHYLAHETKEVHLYGPKRPPAWVISSPSKYNSATTTASGYSAKAPIRPVPSRIRFNRADNYRITNGQSCYPGVGTMGMEAHPLLARASRAGTPR